jgi:hypothetical protein
MALTFSRAPRITFDPTANREQVEPGAATFPRRVQRPEAVLHGFDIGYSDGDHHVLREKIDITDVRVDPVSPTTVRFNVRYLFRDNSGNIDDRYNGWVDVLVLADMS